MYSLAENGYLPRKFLKLNNDKSKFVCSSCVFAQMKRQPWRSRGKPGSIRSPEDTNPGDSVSVDQVVSQQPGLLPRGEGNHSRDRIFGAKVFLDQYSGLSYSHLQTSLDTTQTLEAKHAFEQFADTYSVNILKYRADNGRFTEKVLKTRYNKTSRPSPIVVLVPIIKMD